MALKNTQLKVLFVYTGWPLDTGFLLLLENDPAKKKRCSHRKTGANNKNSWVSLRAMLPFDFQVTRIRH